MADERALDLGCAEAVPRHVEDVVYAAGDPVQTVLVTDGTITGEVEPRELCEVCLPKAVMVTPDAAGLPGPGAAQAEVAADPVPEEDLALLVDQHGIDAREGERGRAGLDGGEAGDGGDEHPAGLGLPPGVDDGAAALADDVVVPLPDAGVDGLPDAAEHAQRAAIVAADVLVALPGDGAQRVGAV